MKRSTNRILTTHVGSLARPHRQLKYLFAKERGENYDRAGFDASTHQAVKDIVAGQVQTGIDVVCDGEQGKSSFLTYITERLEGFSPSENPGEDSSCIQYLGASRFSKLRKKSRLRSTALVTILRKS